MHKFMCILIAIMLVLFVPELISQNMKSTELTLESAVQIALKNNLELQLLLKNIKAKEAVKIQAGLTSNPELEIEAENILGNANFRGFRGAEITVGVSQNILLTGKISSLEKIEAFNVSLAEWDYEHKRLSLITEIKKAFYEALSIKKLINKNLELSNISEELIQNLSSRMKAGKISPAEVYRAQIITNNLILELNQLESDFNASLMILNSIINDSEIQHNDINGKLKDIIEIPSFESLEDKLKNNPMLRRYEDEQNKVSKLIDYEESSSIPSLKISAGYRRLIEVNANTFLVGASIPLPIFDRNQGSIQLAKIEMDKKLLEYISAKKKLSLKLALLYNQLKTLQNTANRLKTESIPEAEKSFDIIKQGNLVGRFTIMDVLDSERTLFVVQNHYLQTIGQLNLVIAEIEGLIAEKIN